MAVAVIMVLGGCRASGPVDATQGIASASPAAPSAPAASPTSRANPSSAPGTIDPSAAPPPPVAWNQLLRVTAAGLAVRRGPTTSAAFAFGAPWDAAAGEWVPTSDEVRLPVGYLMRVSLGPVSRDGIEWYEVTNLTDPDAASDIVQWDTDGDGIYADSGWIAAAEGDAAYVEVLPDTGDGVVPLVFASGGSGTFISEPFEAGGDVGGTWVLVTNELAPCDLAVTLEPSGASLVGTSLIGVFEHNAMGAGGLAQAEYRLTVTAGVDGAPDAECGWSLVLFQSVT